MARLRFSAITPEVTLTGTVGQTVLQVAAPANQRIVLERVGMFFDGTSVTGEPVVVELIQQTTAGTMTSLSTLAKLEDSLPETVQTTAQHTATAEPTGTTVVDAWEVHPQSGYEFMLPLSKEIVIKGGGRLGLKCTAPAGVNVKAKMIIEE